MKLFKRYEFDPIVDVAQVETVEGIERMIINAADVFVDCEFDRVDFLEFIGCEVVKANGEWTVKEPTHDGESFDYFDVDDHQPNVTNLVRFANHLYERGELTINAATDPHTAGPAKDWTDTMGDFADRLHHLDERPKGITFERFKEIAREHAGDHTASRNAARQAVANYPWDGVDALDLEDIMRSAHDANPYDEPTQSWHTYIDTLMSISDQAETEIENS